MPSTVNPESDSVAETLGLNRNRHRRLLGRIVVGVAVLAALAGVAAAWLKRPAEGATPKYETATVVRGALEVKVTATGTLSARDAVDVGSEITGRVLKVLVDFNDTVKAGDILAEIDTEQYQARLDEARAQLAAAKAQVVTAEVTLQESELKASRLESRGSKAPSPSAGC